MYVPASFAVDDLQQIWQFVEQHSFATLVTNHDRESVATHLPLLLDRSAGDRGRLTGHFAKANSHSEWSRHQMALVIFAGPHAYISPTWYAEPRVVPTWNYIAVHAYGVIKPIEDRQRLLAIVEQMVQTYEQTFPVPWQLASQDPHYIDQLLNAITGFEIDVEHWEGKWKLNQNHSQLRRDRVIEALRQQDNDDAREIASWMSQLSDEAKGRKSHE
jgi:transcriptional regulator